MCNTERGFLEISSYRYELFVHFLDFNFSFVSATNDFAPADFTLFPSVTRGPLDSSKLDNTIDFEATPWSQVILDTRAFYQTEALKYPKEVRDTFEELCEDLGHKDPHVLIDEWLSKSVAWTM